jgi:hypothetical protein
MAWNKYYIVVTNQPDAQPVDILTKLDLTDYNLVGKAHFIDTNKSDDLFIGNYKDTLIIASLHLALELFANTPTELERKFITAFPTSQIAILIENSTVGQFGYAIIDKGQRIRLKDGCDGEIYNDIGDLLPEEHTILAGDIFDPQEVDEMREEMDEEEVDNMIKFEASWRTPAEISKRYFGSSIDNLDDDAIKLTRFTKA